MTADRIRNLLLPVLLSCAAGAHAVEPANGTATIQADSKEYTIPVVCDDPSKPESGLYTEPQRVTRERTGRASSVRLTIRPWKETSDLIVNLGRYVAWIPRPSSADGVLRITLAMSPATTLQDGLPVFLTYDDWTAGNRPEGLGDVRIDVNCRYLDPAAPVLRKLPTPG